VLISTTGSLPENPTSCLKESLGPAASLTDDLPSQHHHEHAEHAK